jgi:hypothetical protein
MAGDSVVQARQGLALTTFYPGKSHQFLEAVLKSPEKLRGLAGSPQRSAISMDVP